MSIFMQATHSTKDPLRPIRIWLYAMALLVFCMVLVGGATRLTGSGLSITEWRPVMGVIPPLNAVDWADAFEKYKQIPQYKLQNAGMSLQEFKFIFWWEWSHRLLGRLIGFVFIVPFIVFAAMGRLPHSLWLSLGFILFLGLSQGAMGWFMVYSGLADRVDVSQYRLAAHLSLAALIYASLIWVALGAGRRRSALRSADDYTALFLLLLIFLQIAAGGFVAGLDAGFGYNTWPKMDGAWIPRGLAVMQPWFVNFFENALTVQFQHRMLAYCILLLACFHAWRSFSLSSLLLLYAVFSQVVIGILTLLLHVPLAVALLHQGFAFVVLWVAVWNMHCHLLITPVPEIDRR